MRRKTNKEKLIAALSPMTKSKMSRKEVETLLDMEAYIKYAVKMRDKVSFMEVLSVIAHDVGGLIREEDCFLPRTHGYLYKIDKLGL